MTIKHFKKIYAPYAFFIFELWVSPCFGQIQSSELSQLPFIRSDYRSGEITGSCNIILEHTAKQLDRIARGSGFEGDKTFNILLTFEQTVADFNDGISPLTFMKSVAEDESLRKEAQACEDKTNQFLVAAFSRKDLYEKLARQKTKGKRDRLLVQTLRKFEDNGLMLAEEIRNEVLKLKQRLSSLETQFASYLNEDASFIDCSETELAGLSQEFIGSLKKTETGKYRVTTQFPQFTAIMENAGCAETRRRMLKAYSDRSADKNIQYLEEAIQLRNKIASLMGYRTWADYRTSNRMARDADTVLHFLNGLKEKLSKRNKDDLERLFRFKKEQELTATELKSWDVAYYSYQMKKRDYRLDDELIKPYFPIDTVLVGLFQIYSKLFSLEIIEVKSPKVWAPGIKFYKIQNTNQSTSPKLLGYFYADFFPRTGKYGQAAVFSLRSGRLLRDGSYSQPISALIANFSPGIGDKPALLKYDEVETLFHQFGHVMHQILTRAPFASLSGSKVDQDFLEAPAQMFENWVFSPEILGLISGHYLDPTQKLPRDVLNRIIDSRDFSSGYVYSKQLVYALFDMISHSSRGPVNTISLYRKLFKDILGIDSIENSHFPAGFGHLMSGYDAGYYGYLWSKTYASDMFTRFSKEGLLNPKTGMDFRKIILEPGKMLDSTEVVKKFLNRAVNYDAFYKSLKFAIEPEN